MIRTFDLAAYCLDSCPAPETMDNVLPLERFLSYTNRLEALSVNLMSVPNLKHSAPVPVPSIANRGLGRRRPKRTGSVRAETGSVVLSVVAAKVGCRPNQAITLGGGVH